jgi:hypothetical protein
MLSTKNCVRVELSVMYGPCDHCSKGLPRLQPQEGRIEVHRLGISIAFYADVP